MMTAPTFGDRVAVLAVRKSAKKVKGPPGTTKSQKLYAQLLRAHGRKPGEICKNCANLLRYDHHNKKYLKCRLAGITAGPGTDWRANREACGKWEAEAVASA